eukprot:350843-Chlamydomonas_euryale.AAC.2
MHQADRSKRCGAGNYQAGSSQRWHAANSSSGRMPLCAPHAPARLATGAWRVGQTAAAAPGGTSPRPGLHAVKTTPKTQLSMT